MVRHVKAHLPMQFMTIFIQTLTQDFVGLVCQCQGLQEVQFYPFGQNNALNICFNEHFSKDEL